MSKIRKRKNRILKGICIGTSGLSVFCIVLMIYLCFLNRNYKNKLDKYICRDENISTIYKVNKTIKANDVIKKEDIEAVSLLTERKEKRLNPIEIIGKRSKLDISKGNIIGSDMIYEGENLDDDVRLHNYSYIKLTNKIQIGDYIDIRIYFSNGADFIVLSKKKVLDFSIYNSENGTENALWIEVSEEELLRLSSAAVDGYTNEGAIIYAIEYVEETQKSAISNYPVNNIVKNLIKDDPNIIKKAETVLETNLRKDYELQDHNSTNSFMQKWNNRNDQSTGELDYEKDSDKNDNFDEDSLDSRNDMEENDSKEDIIYVD